MAKVLQDLGVDKLVPKFTLPHISVFWAVLISLFLILGLLIFFVIYKWKVYNIKILEFRDRGNNAFECKLINAKQIEKDNMPQLKLWGRKGRTINYPTGENLIPMRTKFGFMRNIILMHKDKVGDYRPFKPITKAELINVNKYVDKDGYFDKDKFFEELFPVLKIDNLKMRGWYNLMNKETFNIYQEKGEWIKKNWPLMVVLFVVFGIGIGAYLLFGS